MWRLTAQKLSSQHLKVYTNACTLKVLSYSSATSLWHLNILSPGEGILQAEEERSDAVVAARIERLLAQRSVIPFYLESFVWVPA